jgi:hypothetical protein
LVKLGEIVKAMVDAKHVALIWTMIRSRKNVLVGWDTIVIVNPFFSVKPDTQNIQELKYLGMILTTNLVEPLLRKRGCDVEVAIVHNETCGELCKLLKNSIEDFLKITEGNSIISLDQAKACIFNHDESGVNGGDLQQIYDFEKNVMIKGY